MQRRLVQNFTFVLELGQGTCSLTKNTRRWTFSALRYSFLLNCLKKVNGEKLDELLCDHKFKVVETGIVDIKIYLRVSLFFTLLYSNIVFFLQAGNY